MYFCETVSLPARRGDAEVGLHWGGFHVACDCTASTPHVLSTMGTGVGLGSPGQPAEEEMRGHPLRWTTACGDLSQIGGGARGRLQGQPPQPWPPHPSSWAMGFVCIFSDLLCQDQSPRLGEEVNLATAGKDTMSQWWKGTKNNEISREQLCFFWELQLQGSILGQEQD